MENVVLVGLEIKSLRGFPNGCFTKSRAKVCRIFHLIREDYYVSGDLNVSTDRDHLGERSPKLSLSVLTFNMLDTVVRSHSILK